MELGSTQFALLINYCCLCVGSTQFALSINSCCLYGTKQRAMKNSCQTSSTWTADAEYFIKKWVHYISSINFSLENNVID